MLMQTTTTMTKEAQFKIETLSNERTLWLTAKDGTEALYKLANDSEQTRTLDSKLSIWKLNGWTSCEATLRDVADGKLK